MVGFWLWSCCVASLSFCPFLASSSLSFPEIQWAVPHPSTSQPSNKFPFSLNKRAGICCLQPEPGQQVNLYCWSCYCPHHSALPSLTDLPASPPAQRWARIDLLNECMLFNDGWEMNVWFTNVSFYPEFSRNSPGIITTSYRMLCPLWGVGMHKFLYLILTKMLIDRYSPHFTDEETVSKRLSRL